MLKLTRVSKFAPAFRWGCSRYDSDSHLFTFSSSPKIQVGRALCAVSDLLDSVAKPSMKILMGRHLLLVVKIQECGRAVSGGQEARLLLPPLLHCAHKRLEFLPLRS